jgi:hypothetical protein
MIEACTALERTVTNGSRDKGHPCPSWRGVTAPESTDAFADRPKEVHYRLISSWILILALAPAYAPATTPGACPIQLVDVTAESGITFRHTDGGSGQQYIVESIVAGLALLDYDGDGLIDIYFLNGAPLKGTVVETRPRNAMYRNNGDWTFTDVTDAAHVGHTGYGLGVAAGDYDNDGDQDLYVNNFGPNVLYRNNGDGTFSDVTDQAGVASGDKVGAGVCFLDMDSDCDLDLYAANYVDFTYENHVSTMLGRYRYSDPKDYRAVPDSLFRNNGDGTFTEVSVTSGVSSVAGTSMGLVSFDYDDDGDADVFVCNDVAANFLFQNDGSGRFEEQGLLAGLAYNFEGRENASMGADCGDFDNDGRLDLFMTDYTDEMPVLYHNLGHGFFEDAASDANVGSRAFPHVNWGTGLIDFDNDGNRDIFIAGGHVMDNIRHIDDRTAYRVRNILLMNTGDARFVDVTDRCGNGLDPIECSKGTAFDDLDNDGDIDAVVLNANAQPTLLRNQSETDHHWLQVRLRGVKGNRDGVGARVRVIAGDLAQVAEVHSGRGYQSHYGTRLSFGLGEYDHVDLIEVRWLGGGVDVYRDLPTDRLVVLTAGAESPDNPVLPSQDRRSTMNDATQLDSATQTSQVGRNMLSVNRLTPSRRRRLAPVQQHRKPAPPAGR